MSSNVSSIMFNKINGWVSQSMNIAAATVVKATNHESKLNLNDEPLCNFSH